MADTSDSPFTTPSKEGVFSGEAAKSAAKELALLKKKDPLGEAPPREACSATQWCPCAEKIAFRQGQKRILERATEAEEVYQRGMRQRIFKAAEDSNVATHNATHSAKKAERHYEKMKSIDAEIDLLRRHLKGPSAEKQMLGLG